MLCRPPWRGMRLPLWRTVTAGAASLSAPQGARTSSLASKNSNLLRLRRVNTMVQLARWNGRHSNLCTFTNRFV